MIMVWLSNEVEPALMPPVKCTSSDHVCREASLIWIRVADGQVAAGCYRVRANRYYSSLHNQVRPRCVDRQCAARLVVARIALVDFIVDVQNHVCCIGAAGSAGG